MNAKHNKHFEFCIELNKPEKEVKKKKGVTNINKRFPSGSFLAIIKNFAKILWGWIGNDFAIIRDNAWNLGETFSRDQIFVNSAIKSLVSCQQGDVAVARSKARKGWHRKTHAFFSVLGEEALNFWMKNHDFAWAISRRLEFFDVKTDLFGVKNLPYVAHQRGSFKEGTHIGSPKNTFFSGDIIKKIKKNQNYVVIKL